MILGVIPARGGSKGIPKKNMKIVAGKPLLLWTIEQAKKSKLLDDLLISSEDKSIGRFAEKNVIPWLKRPVELSTDNASTLSVLEHVVLQYPQQLKTVVLLQPTSPIRSKDLIDFCINCFFKNDLDSLATGFISKDAEYGEHQHYRRQDYRGMFCDDGNVYIIKADLLKNHDRIGKRYGGVIVSREENLEIDDLLDLEAVENLIKNPLKGRHLTGIRKGSRREFVLLSSLKSQ